jgi:hypothetical protein
VSKRKIWQPCFGREKKGNKISFVAGIPERVGRRKGAFFIVAKVQRGF